jgi:hypothetical protein
MARTSRRYSGFWRGVLLPESKLFESAEGPGGGSLLPRRDASEERLRLVGRFFCKSVVDEQEIGRVRRRAL